MNIKKDMATTNTEPFNNLINNIAEPTAIWNITQSYFYDLMKILLLIFLFFYTIVALFTIKQISLMTRTVKTSSNKYIYLIAYIHLVAVLFCLVFSLLVL